MKYLLNFKTEKMKKYILIITALLFTTLATAQIDETRMKRDLEVATTVLNSLVNNSGVMRWSGVNGSTEGRYIDGYGVILSMPNNHVIFGNIPFERFPENNSRSFIIRDSDTDLSVTYNDDIEEMVEELTEQALEIEEARSLNGRAQKMAERDQELALREQELALKAQKLANKTISVLRLDSLKAENDEKRIYKMQLFLLDYAHLISQLKPDEKVLVVDKSNQVYGNSSFYNVETAKRNKLSVEITMADAKAYQQGKISREEALSRLVINKNNQPKKVYKDLELFSSIFDRLYSRDLAETYYKYGKVSYDKIDGLGALFFMKTVSSVKADDDFWRLPTQDERGLNQQERDKLVKSLYPKFEEQLKENLITYGRTITSLKEDEKLIFKAKITQCDGCDIPKNIELSIGMDDLAAYNSGTLNMQEAMARVTINEGDLQ